MNDSVGQALIALRGMWEGGMSNVQWYDEVDAFEAAIRADEREKVGQSESALRVAAMKVIATPILDSMLVNGDSRGYDGAKDRIDEMEFDDHDVAALWSSLRALRAALDGEPYEPSDAEVERAARGVFVATGGGALPYLDTRAIARSALKAAFS